MAAIASCIARDDIMREANVDDVRVRVTGFCDLFAEAPLPLALDSYQRPYVWDEEKIRVLIEDLEGYAANIGSRSQYYMGTLLLHENRQVGKCFIIDGQQRLTTLCILHRMLVGHPPANCDLRYRSPKSWTNIRAAEKIFECGGLSAFQLAHLNRLCFSIITVSAEDLAFTFFDTQNSRGVRPSATDLLKAYHLREIPGAGRDLLQQQCARRWEELQAAPPILGNTTDFAPALFEYLLWRARRWTGSRVKILESDDDIIREFQKETHRQQTHDAGKVPLYQARSNRRATHLILQSTNEHRLIEESPRPSDDPATVPFALRQPISAGVGFFLYAAKYTALSQALFHAKPRSTEVEEFQGFYRDVYMPLSVYLREFFVLACVMYADQFGHEQLMRFALWLDYALGSIRLGKRSVYQASPVAFLQASPINLLDVIAHSFRPLEVFKHLREIPIRPEIYLDHERKFNGVQRSYVESIRSYYATTSDLAGRAGWIEAKLEQLKLA